MPIQDDLLELTVAFDALPSEAPDDTPVGFGLRCPKIGSPVQGQFVNPLSEKALGESRPYWQFAHHEAHPLLGCQSVYAVLDAPEDAAGVRLSVELVATLETRYGGLIRVGLPEEARVHIGRTVGT